MAPPNLDDCQLVVTTERRHLPSDCFKCTVIALVHVMETEPSLLPDHAFGVVFPRMSLDLICPWTNFTGN